MQLEEENKTKRSHFQIENYVMVKLTTKKPNIYEKKYFGPCKIVGVINPKSYLLQYKNAIIRRNYDLLKLFNGQLPANTSDSLGTTSIRSVPISNQQNSDSLLNPRYPCRIREAVKRYRFNSVSGGDVV